MLLIPDGSDYVSLLALEVANRKYVNERRDAVSNGAYVYVIGSAIAKGRIVSIDVTQAKAVSGVLAVITSGSNENTAKQICGLQIHH